MSSCPLFHHILRFSLTNYEGRRFSSVFSLIETSRLFISVKYTPQWHWIHEEFERVDREKTPWLIVLMHVPIYNSNEAHFEEGDSMRSVFESLFVKYRVDVVFAGHVHAYERSVCCSFLFNPYGDYA